jgi:hypothetical protein
MQLMGKIKACKAAAEAVLASASDPKCRDTGNHPSSRLESQAPDTHLKIRDSRQQPQLTQQAAECVNIQFSRTGMSGIRSLPSALHPDFRLQLYAALVILGKERQMAQRERRAHMLAAGKPGGVLIAQEQEIAAATALLLAHSTKGPPLQNAVRPSVSAQCSVMLLIEGITS